MFETYNYHQDLVKQNSKYIRAASLIRVLYYIFSAYMYSQKLKKRIKYRKDMNSSKYKS